MFEDYYMTADDVAKALKISKSFAYKVIRKMNAELQEQGFFTMAGKVNKQFFLDKTCYDAAKVKEGCQKCFCVTFDKSNKTRRTAAKEKGSDYLKRTISGMVGKGSLRHNNRTFHAGNVDPERSHQNIAYCDENIRDVYHELFDEALEKYNAKQTRADRMIDDYYEKIRFGKQEMVSLYKTYKSG